ncbi:MAG: cation-translocating P-type ATPase [Actinomycetota bacterium]
MDLAPGSDRSRTAIAGLTADEASRRLLADGPNRIVPRDRRERWRRLLGPLADPMVALLLVAAPTYLLIGETTDAIVAIVAVVPIAAVGWLLEARAERTLDALRQMTAPTAIVVRDGEQQSVPVEDLVVGDVIWLHEGDVVPADADLLELTQIQVDESALTGESLPVAKAPADPVWAGTTVLAGRAVAVVAATGERTRYGRIGSLVADVGTRQTPLQRALAKLVRALAVLAAAFCAAVVAAELLRGAGWGNAVIAGVSLAIAAIPEEFAMVYGLYLALGAWRLSREGALVRRLPGVETLGSTTVICADKTGTLTEGSLAVGSATPLPSNDDDAARLELLETAVLACEPDPFDPLDLAILAEARRSGVDVDGLHGGRLVTDWPFDPKDRYLTHLWRRTDGSHRVAAKGALEGLLRRLSVEAHDRRQLEALNRRLADDGMRVIAVAGTDVAGPTGNRPADEVELALLGVVGFTDPIRAGVEPALAECRAAGIRVVMITGDHPATAHAVAEGLGLPHQGPEGDLIATGADLDTADGEALEQLVAQANVFARTRPEQKHLLVEALRARGEVVAMTGDGINDAPALRAADIGVAMGRRGTEVARQASTMVLLDDSFATIVAAVRDGRRIYDNLSRAFAYLIAFHPPLLLGALVVPLLGRPLLLLPVHLVMLELVLHPIVSLVFQADPADADVMSRPPRPVSHGLSARALWHPYAVGLALAGAFVATYLVLLEHWPEDEARGAALAVLLLSQPLLILVARSPGAPLWRTPLRPTRELVGSVAAVLTVTAASIHLAPLAELLSVAPFPIAAWPALVAVAAVATLALEPLKGRRRVDPSDGSSVRGAHC